MALILVTLLAVSQTVALGVVAYRAERERARLMDALIARTPAELVALRKADRPAPASPAEPRSDVHFPIGL